MEWKKTLPRWRWAYYFSPWNGWLLLESVRQKRTGELTGMTQPKCLRLGFLVERLWCRKWSVTGTVFVLVNADLYYVWRGSVTHRKKKKVYSRPSPLNHLRCWLKAKISSHFFSLLFRISFHALHPLCTGLTYGPRTLLEAHENFSISFKIGRKKQTFGSKKMF